MDLRSMSDKDFVSYRTNFFSEIRDWTPDELAKSDEIIQESNRRLAVKRLQIMIPGGLDEHLPEDILKKIATSAPLRAKGIRTKRKKKRRKRRTKKKTRKNKHLGGVKRNTDMNYQRCEQYRKVNCYDENGNSIPTSLCSKPFIEECDDVYGFQ
uniref:Uncharacterized protein n=1 Tax=viral metagenome TaxID=1070528 RepID=A0A6C0F516_9ZZZZ|tara:strand:+ start:273 stop:734 length:462 start_codon:yes stop_codon:yes gene_type:complete